LDEDYWRFLGDPIYDSSSEKSVDFEAHGQPNITEANSEFFAINFWPYSFVNHVEVF
jgi:hypothetical protein